MKDRGVTLIELLVVISVIGILAVALGFSYVGWQGRYKVEKAIKEIHTDLMTARSMAMTRNRDYFVTFPAVTSYSVIADADDDGVADDAALPTFPKTLEYPVNSWTGGTIVFDRRGIVEPSLTPTGNTIRLTVPADVDPDYDCIAISQTRIAMGKWNGTTSLCDVK